VSARRRWAWPLVPVYGAVLAAKDLLRAGGLLPRRRLRQPVVSIGSVSAGGAGKTPVVIALATLLRERGWAVSVLTRGYGRKGRGVLRVDLEHPEPAARYGDEPVVIAERTGVPVWVGGSRFHAGSAAERDPEAFAAVEEVVPEDTVQDGAGVPPSVHLLDDGMQHRELRRDFELVLLTAEDLGDTLLPAGNLREPLAALRRADAFAVREEELETVSEWLHRYDAFDVPIWTLRRTLRFPQPLGVFTAGLRPLAFCALARPENFAAMLAEAGCGVVDTVIFPDHHRYSERDLLLLVRMAKELEASGLVTTEKDAVKLTTAARLHLEEAIGPLMVVRLQASFVFESPVVRTLEQRLRAAAEETRAAEARVR
jgi:tetraacyldisaccharide 4'-kinase